MALEIIDRSEWVQPGYPMKGPIPDRSLWQAVIYHYPGGNVRSATRADTISLCQRMNRDYWTSRKFALGYGFVIGTGGHCVEVRGMDIRNAANDGTPALTGVPNYNHYTVSVQLAVAGDAPATQAQLAVIAELHPWIEVIVGRRLRVEGHGTRDSTPCPGAGIRGQLDDIERLVHPPIPIPPVQEDDMAQPLFFAHQPGSDRYYLCMSDVTKRPFPSVHAVAHFNALRAFSGQPAIPTSDFPASDPMSWESFGPVVGDALDGADRWGLVRS